MDRRAVSVEDYEREPTLRASQIPGRQDGLSIVTVDPNRPAIYTSYVRRPTDDGFLIEKHGDSRTDEHVLGYEGRLSELFKPLPDGGHVTHAFY